MWGFFLHTPIALIMQTVKVLEASFNPFTLKLVAGHLFKPGIPHRTDLVDHSCAEDATDSDYTWAQGHHLWGLDS